jgi:hypothetical protein
MKRWNKTVDDSALKVEELTDVVEDMTIDQLVIAIEGVITILRKHKYSIAKLVKKYYLFYGSIVVPLANAIKAIFPVIYHGQKTHKKFSKEYESTTKKIKRDVDIYIESVIRTKKSSDIVFPRIFDDESDDVANAESMHIDNFIGKSK